MTDTSHAADVAPAAASTSSGRALSLPGWDGGPDRERDRLIAAGAEHRRGPPAAALLPALGPSVRAPQLASAGQDGQQRASRSQQPRRVAAPPMNMRRRCCAATASRSTRAISRSRRSRRSYTGRRAQTSTPALTGPASPRPRASSTRSCAEHTPRSRSTCRTRPCSVMSELSVGRSPPASVCRPGRPMTSRGGCSRTPTNSIRASCGHGGSPPRHGCR